MVDLIGKVWGAIKDLIVAGDAWQIAFGLMGLYFATWAAMIYTARLIRPYRHRVAAWYRKRRTGGR